MLQKWQGAAFAFTVGGEAAPHLLPLTYYFPKIPLRFYFETRVRKQEIKSKNPAHFRERDFLAGE